MARILVVEDSPVEARHVEFILAGAGHACTVVPGGPEAIEAIRRCPPDLVLTDFHMPRMSGLELASVLKTEFPGVPVVMTTDRGSEELAVQSLRAGASGYLPKRYLARDLVNLAEELLAVGTMRAEQSKLLSRMTGAEYRFVLENDPSLSSQVVGQVEGVLKQFGAFSEATQMRLGIAVHEAVVNAVVHGNLEVSSDLKLNDWEAYHALVKRRSGEAPYRDRRVTVTIRATREPLLEVTVRDEGRGYDPAALPDPTEPENIERACGRGLLMIRTFFDEVTHTDGGRVIVMAKRG